MKKIIISLIAFTASLLNLGYSQFAVHSIIDFSGAYSFNYYENKSWSVFPPNLLIDPKNNKNCTIVSKLWGMGDEYKTIKITSESIKVIIMITKAKTDTRLTHKYQATIRIPKINFTLPGVYIHAVEYKNANKKLAESYAIGVTEKYGSDDLNMIFSKYPIEIICPALKYGL